MSSVIISSPRTTSTLLAIADDLTGAAEIAAAGHRAGWRAQVAMRESDFAGADLTVIDTDTRLMPPEIAAQRLAAIGAEAARHMPRLIYKKTDSVLRGPVRAELTALAVALGRKTVLFVPANPALGRTIRDGRYFVRGVPLEATAFAGDPHHPAHTSVVADLLGRSADVSVLRPEAPLPSAGIVIGEAASSADVLAWAARVTPDILPAGGGEFFSAVLQAQVGPGPATPEAATPGRPALLVSGSLASPLRPSEAITLPREVALGSSDAALTDWTERVLETLSARPLVAVAAPADRLDDAHAAARIRQAFAQLVARGVRARAFRHLLVEGGATAAEILNTLGWTRLAVAREWAQGVVSLQPAAANDVVVTMKPGSYAWPEPLRLLVQPEA